MSPPSFPEAFAEAGAAIRRAAWEAFDAVVWPLRTRWRTDPAVRQALLDAESRLISHFGPREPEEHVHER